MAFQDSSKRVQAKEQVRSGTGDSYERRERIVEDVGREQRLWVNRVIQFIELVFGVVEGLIGLRFFLKLIAANPNNLIAAWIYRVSDIFLQPFIGLTVSPELGGFVLELPALIAMLVYALIGWVVVRLAWILLARVSARSVEIYEREQRS